MAKEKNIINFTLASGVKVEIDLSKNKARLLDEARRVCKDDENGYETIHYILSNIATFDGKELNTEQMKDEFSAFDMLELEAKFGELRKKQ